MRCSLASLAAAASLSALMLAQPAHAQRGSKPAGAGFYALSAIDIEGAAQARAVLSSCADCRLP
jgi:hypothetical protein